VFDAQSSDNFSPTEQCPAYSVPQGIASAVYNKERQDEAQFAQLVVRGVPTVASTTRAQGGMNATYLAALKANGGPGRLRQPFTTRSGRMRRSSRSLSFVEYLRLRAQPGGKAV
jgi:hypothetical protein